ncbi:hypothetical protein CERSUDRAFT_71602 [Gelatoporia subvermispora B]|uniref:Uncharacterized protein n=1 Tax=Ceriporiopsis subvermispora (strain B) TaxID=914234 RepID=M2RLJ6_CERS8|nr:hypothetical protein CERSUDRAFT_71602 [Gelatoporia subvermispora B]
MPPPLPPPTVPMRTGGSSSNEANNPMEAHVIGHAAAESEKLLSELLNIERNMPENGTILRRVQKAAWHLHHWLGPCVTTDMVIRLGLRLMELEDDSTDLKSLNDWSREQIEVMDHMDREFHYESFCLLLEKVPELPTYLECYAEKSNTVLFVGVLARRQASARSPSGIGPLIPFVLQCARNDEIRLLKQNITWYLPKLLELGLNTSKEQWGFNSTISGRYLCPQLNLVEYDQDPEQEIDITADNFPSFLYNELLAKEDQVEPGLLRSRALLQCLRCILTGPRTANKDKCGRLSRKPSRAKMAGIIQIDPQNIAYIAAITHFVLSNQTSWVSVNGNFDNQEFFRAVVCVFHDGVMVFGTVSCTADKLRKQKKDQSSVTCLRAEHAARDGGVASG